LHPDPLGKHWLPHVPKALQVSEQHCVASEHIPPSGVHIPQFCPQIVLTSLTHKPSHDVLQQNGSVMQIDETHGPQFCDSGPPISQTSCEQESRQTPFEHTCEQHWVLFEQDEPVGAHIPPPQMLLVHKPVQHWNDAMHACPLGKHGPTPQMLLLQTPLQHSNGWAHLNPSGKHMPKPQTPPLQIPLQQSSGTLHPKPSGWHIPKPQTPPLHTPLQQSKG
jgi:hypothetical protein